MCLAEKAAPKYKLKGKEWQQTENRQKQRDAVKLVRMLTKENPSDSLTFFECLLLEHEGIINVS